MEMICEVAPAKINLTLEVLGKRGDGYHEIESVMQTIDICDLLTFWENDWIKIIPEYSGLPDRDNLFGEDKSDYLFDNLVYKAALLLKEASGYSGGALVQLRKTIPSSAGLGGGSSDAAATLKGLNKLWGLGLKEDELAGLGAKIGSDIPYFIYGGTCLVRGRGERIEKIPRIPSRWLLIIMLPIRISRKTTHLYSCLKPSYYTGGSFTSRLMESLGDGAKNGFDGCFFNVFEKIYGECFDRFVHWGQKLEETGISPIHLTGSGPAVYYMAESRQKAKEAIGRLDALGLNGYIARTVP
ncbi:MAG: 4-(cytidine 5'-diphospho)-2-C-methyl-D-erythritol kinase [Actinomycetota bacterium]